MIGTGGSALVARTLGEGDSGRAQRYFSMLVYVTIGGGIVFSVLGLLFLRPIAVLLGAQGAMLEDCVVYGGILLAGQTMFMLQNVFQSFLITAEKPHFGLGVTEMCIRDRCSASPLLTVAQVTSPRTPSSPRYCRNSSGVS